MRPNTVKRRQLLKIYIIIKQRLFFALQNSKNENYRVRQKYYIIIELLRALKDGDVNTIKLPTLLVADSQGIANKAARYILY